MITVIVINCILYVPFVKHCCIFRLCTTVHLWTFQNCFCKLLWYSKLFYHSVISCLIQSIWQRQYYIQLPKKSLFKHQNQLFKLTLVKYKLHHIIVKANCTFSVYTFPKMFGCFGPKQVLRSTILSSTIVLVFFDNARIGRF